MATTPSRPRQSTSRIGIPTPVKSSATGSAIPTPGRSRSSSRAGPPTRADVDTEQMARAFQQAIRNRDPRDQDSIAHPVPAHVLSTSHRPGSVASTSSAASIATPRSSLARPKTPTQSRPPIPRPQSRQSDVFRSSSRAGTNKAFEPGDHVRIESLGFEGTLRYLGSIEGKPGTWAGVELASGFAGLGKNDGSVGGVSYFQCAPKGGVFVALNKLSIPPIWRPISVSSHTDGRSTPANSISGRTTPLYSTPSARPRNSKLASLPPPPSNDTFSTGSRASKYASMTADRLRNAAEAFNNSPSSRRVHSPNHSPSRDLSPSRTQQGRSSPTRTPKPSGRASRTSDVLASPVRIDFVTPKQVPRASISSSIGSPRRSASSTASPEDSQNVSAPGSPVDPHILKELRKTVEEQKVELQQLRSENEQQKQQNQSFHEELRTTSSSLEDAEARIKSLTVVVNRAETLERELSERDKELQDTRELLEKSNVSYAELQSSTTLTSTSLKQELQDKEALVESLELKVTETNDQFESERKYLNSQISELRSAGQETIALYEDRLSTNEDRRYELEDLVATLQDKVASLTRPLSPASIARHASEAAQIDNETLREQAEHLQKRINLLEEKLEDAKVSAESEEAAARQRTDKHREAEATLKKEVEGWKGRVEEDNRESRKAKDRIIELEEALRENATALENTRAEVETLRAELVIWQNSGEPAPSQDLSDSKRHEARYDKVSAALSTLQREHDELRDEYQAINEKSQLLTQISEELQTTINEQQAVIDRLQDGAKMVLSGSPEKESKTNRHDLAEKREEIAGLKRIVQQLTQENAALASQVKITEAERSLLLSETEQLREDLKIIEEKVEQSILREDPAAQSQGILSSSEMETEVIELRRKVTEQEHKHARIVHDLNKEISELETLVESKIYREDELERELERYKEKASRASKKPRASKQADDTQERGTDISINGQASHAPVTCEICEQPGHDIFTCPILQGDKAATKPVAPSITHLWCEDCERPGHVAVDCPHSMDVF